jgi:hypothetical protein
MDAEFSHDGSDIGERCREFTLFLSGTPAGRRRSKVHATGPRPV